MVHVAIRIGISRRILYPKVLRSEGARPELHVFADASEVAYGVACYLRYTQPNKEVSVAFVYGKARLALLKQLTIPRLELCAALLAAQVARTLESELTTMIHGITLWTDSVLVLQYIRNPSQRFKTYVANRVTSIQRLTQPDQWRHVPTHQNPADDASRGLTAAELLADCRWKDGPAFLWEVEEQWPRLPAVPACLLDASETKREATTLAMATPEAKGILHNLWTRYSTWTTLLRAVAYLRRFLDWRVGPNRGR